MEFLDQVHEVKSRRGRIAVFVAVIAVFLCIALIAGGNDGRLSEGDALSRVPSLALSEAELALADTILDHEDFRNALSYDLVENTTAFTPEAVMDVIASVIPAGAEVTEVRVSGAVVIIGYSLPYQRITLEYVDADRSGKVDMIQKTLIPLIDGSPSGRYQVRRNLTTDKIVYTYTSN